MGNIPVSVCLGHLPYLHAFQGSVLYHPDAHVRILVGGVALVLGRPIPSSVRTRLEGKPYKYEKKRVWLREHCLQMCNKSLLGKCCHNILLLQWKLFSSIQLKRELIVSRCYYVTRHSQPFTTTSLSFKKRTMIVKLLNNLQKKILKTDHQCFSLVKKITTTSFTFATTRP